MRLGLGLIASALVAAVGCGSSDSKSAPPGDAVIGCDDGGHAGGSGFAGNGGDAGGSGDDGGGGAGGAGGSDGGIPTDASADGDGGEVDGGPADAAIEFNASDIACASDVAFKSGGVSFIFPTAVRFAQQVGQFLTDPATHDLMLVMRGSKGEAADGALSFVTMNGSSDWEFPFSQKPQLAPVSITQGRFGTTSPQAIGFLKFHDDAGDVYLELDQLSFSAFTQNGCQQMVATVDAILPGTQASKVIQAGGQSYTVGDLADMASNGQFLSVPIRFVVVGDASNFAFSSL